MKKLTCFLARIRKYNFLIGHKNFAKCKIFLVFCIFIILLPGVEGAKDVSPLWTYSIDGSIKSLRISNESIFLGAEDGYVYSFNRMGKLVWRYRTDGVNSVHASKNYVMATSISGYIYLLNKTGEREWIRQLDSYVGYPDAIYLSDDYSAVGLMDGYVYIFNKKGDIIGVYKTDAYVSTVRIFDDSVAAVSDKDVYILNLNGSLKFRYNVRNYIRSSYISENYTVVGLGNDDLYLYDLNGKLRWNYHIDSQIGAISISGGYIAAGSRDGTLYLFDIADGKLKWSKQLGSSVIHIDLARGNIATATLDGYLYLFNTNEKLEWKYKGNGHVSSMKISDKELISGSVLGNIYYFKLFERDRGGSVFVVTVMVLIIIIALIMFLMSIR